MTKLRDRVVFVVACIIALSVVGCWMTTGPPTQAEIIRMNEGE